MVVDPFDPHPRSRPQVVNNSNHSSPTTSSLNNIDCDDDLDAFEVSGTTLSFVFLREGISGSSLFCYTYLTFG